ncbi:inhibitor of nuclear factor kappa-B kinase-interacting protein isoform X1 [Hypomesus transpacificus]|uniref:inhibitor of nuclear factor kappa-B kinase-interacting protein isoform X1 n=1 Tax=Hypomesus transpacificus TaxID=137520 RepID=UPI001F087A42|nr:inhibitor of nuclear factor kappa-B kinase-interacting protein isoform X1 [Hypomesus transpacificus]
MPNNEVKQRKKTQKPNEQSSNTPNNCEDEAKKVETTKGVHLDLRKTSVFSLDLRTIACLLSVVVCTVLTWVVLKQNEKLTDVEEKYKHLYGKTANLLEMEEEVLKVTKKLTTSEDELQGALSTASVATRLQQDIFSLHAAINAMQADEKSASHDLQVVNGRFLNVTETWQERLAAVTADLATLKVESREAHGGATDRVNEAERRARALEERLEELEDSTRRNARALERSEDEDTKRAQDQLDWNTKQIHKMEDKIRALIQADAEMGAQLQEHIPRAQQCETHVPDVEEAVRSILRLGGDLSGAERRLEELTLQVFGTEDSMLKALTEILEIKQGLDALQAHNSILKMKNELGVVAEAVRELSMVVMGVGSLRAEDEESVEAEEDEEWEDPQADDPSQLAPDDDRTV